MNGDGVGGYDVGDVHRGRIDQIDLKNVPNENVSASRKRISLSLCPWKNEIGPTMEVLNGPICEIDLNGDGDGGLRRDESCVSDCY